MQVQLVLIGGRSSVPNTLTIRYQKPEVIFALCSHESYRDFDKFKQMVQVALPTCTVEALAPVDAFELEEIASQCIAAFKRYPEGNWLCNVTAATSIMSIAVYEQAKFFQKDCWYINTSKSRVITLTGSQIDEKKQKEIFHLSVLEYISSYYYSLIGGDLEDRRTLCEQDWWPFAQLLGQHPIQINHLKRVMEATYKQRKPGKVKGPETYIFQNMPQEDHNIIEEAGKIGLASDVRSENGVLTFTLDYMQYSFLNGGWLELYVWHEAKQICSPNNDPLFDDCQWNHKITIEGTHREIDVAMMYQAQLIIAECKTGKDADASETLHGLETVANHLGAKFVGKILVASLFSPEKDPDQYQENRTEAKQKSHIQFLEKAHQHHIVPIMAEDLPRLREILEREAVNPTYPRI